MIASSLIVLVTLTVLVPVDQMIALPFGGSYATLLGTLFLALVTLVASARASAGRSGMLIVMGTTPITVAALLGGPTAGAWVALIGSTEPRELRGEVPWYGLGANHAMAIIGATVAGVFGYAMRVCSPDSLGLVLVFTVAAAAIADLLDGVTGAALGWIALALRSRQSVATVIRSSAHEFAITAGGGIVVAMLMTALYIWVSWWMAALCLVPLLAVQLSAERYVVSWQADRDPLTGLSLRREFSRQLGAASQRARHATGTSGLLVLDLDGFKAINDTYGHETGDRVLQEVAARIIASIRAGDTAARLGGDEFALILPDVGSESIVRRRAEALVSSLGTPMMIDGHSLSVGVSIGGGLFPTADDPTVDVVAQADAAMYYAKRNGGGYQSY